VFNSELEFKSKRRIAEEQLQHLRALVSYAKAKSPFYKKILSRTRIKHVDIKSLNDIQKLPITTKGQMQRHNRKFYCVGQKDIAEIVSTTGTTGEPVFVVLTKQDLQRLALNEARSFYCANTGSLDTFHIAVTLDRLFMAGMAYYLGITKLGASVFRVGMHNVKKHISLIKRLKPTGIVTVPSFLITLIEEMRKDQIAPRSLSLKKAVLIGDNIRDEDFKLCGAGSLIARAWPLKLYSTYGNSEAAISFCECGIGAGAHEHPDLVFSEILDERGNSLPNGETGELALTTLQTQGMPLLRYRTGDITFKITEKCKCGRNSSRIGPILGRKAQMLKFKGTKVYPKTIENAIAHINGVFNYAIEAFTGNDFSDRVVVKIGCYRKSKDLKKTVCAYIESYARVTPVVKLVSVKEVESLRTDSGHARKPRVFIDYRIKKEKTENI